LLLDRLEYQTRKENAVRQRFPAPRTTALIINWRNIAITLIDPVVGLITCLRTVFAWREVPFSATVGSGESFGLSPSSPS
jgi:hypothetical protein